MLSHNNNNNKREFECLNKAGNVNVTSQNYRKYKLMFKKAKLSINKAESKGKHLYQ